MLLLRARGKMNSELFLYNEIFMQNQSFGDETNPDVFSYFEKNSYVCLSAPHATKTFVANHLKKSDLYTGSIVRYIAEHQNYSYVVRNKYVPQTVLVSDFILKNHIENHFFLDIHAMQNGKGFDLAVGTGYLKPERYEQQLKFIDSLSKKYGLKYVINDKNYTGKIGLTGRLQQATGQANVLQLEWSLEYRDIFNSLKNVEKVTIPFISELGYYFEKDKNY